jgi:hypothetical protein
MKMMRFKHRDDRTLLDTSVNCVDYPMDTAPSKYQKISHESSSSDPTWEEADPTDEASVMNLPTHAPDPEEDTGEDYIRL